MKKILHIILSIVIMLTIAVPVFAANGDVVGHIYSTDIRAYINGVEVESYNIGGKTAVVIEDILKANSYPYSWIYDDASRLLKFFTLSPDFLNGVKTQNQAKPGKILGNIYETDIKTSIYDVVIPTYNIGGKTAVAIEDLGYDKEFSPIGGKFIWNDTEREIKLEFLYENRSGVSDDKDINISVNESMTETIATFEEKFHCEGGQEHFVFPDYITDDSNIEVILPIKAQGDTIGYYFRRPSKTYKFTAFAYYYPEKVKEAEKIYKPYPKQTREEIISHFLNHHSVGEPVARFDTDDYSFVYISVAGPSWTAYNLLQAYDDGTYIDYGGIIYQQNRAPSNLVIDKENEKVTFRYIDRYTKEWFTDYEIDLKRGEIKPIESEDEEISTEEPETDGLNYNIHLTDKKEQTNNCEGKFSIEYTPDGVTKSGDTEYFSSFISSNGNEYEIVIDFSNGLYADDLIQLFKSVSSGSQALPIHDEEEKYAAVNKLINVTINGQATEKVAVSTVLWNDSSTVYIYIRDIPPISISEIDKIYIGVNK